MKIIKVSVLQNLKTFLTLCQSQNSKMKVEPGNLWTSSQTSAITAKAKIDAT